MEFLHPGNIVIQKLIESYKAGTITSIYGPAASGKTTLCFHAAIECAKQGHKVAFLDTENGFNTKRINQMDGKAVLDNVFLFRIKSLSDQGDALEKVFALSKKDNLKLVIVDTVTSFYRVLLNQAPKKTNEEFIQQLRTIKHIARDNKRIVILTSQVYSKLSGDKEINPVSGNLLKKFSEVLIELNYDEKNQRIARLMKPEKSENMNFYIDQSGIRATTPLKTGSTY